MKKYVGIAKMRPDSRMPLNAGGANGAGDADALDQLDGELHDAGALADNESVRNYLVTRPLIGSQCFDRNISLFIESSRVVGLQLRPWNG